MTVIRQSDSLFDLMDAFPDEQACIDHLRAIRWRDGEFCPYCGGTRIYTFSDRRTHKCGDCKARFSIKVGTIFHDSKLPLRKWFMAMWLITSHKKGIASTTLAKDLKITQKTAWFVLHRLRHAARTNSFSDCAASNSLQVARRRADSGAVRMITTFQSAARRGGAGAANVSDVPAAPVRHWLDLRVSRGGSGLGIGLCLDLSLRLSRSGRSAALR
jgi:transposase-like protein